MRAPKKIEHDLEKLSDWKADFISTRQSEILQEAEELYEKQYSKLIQELKYVDPYNDLFHLACPNWPNCDEVGCGR